MRHRRWMGGVAAFGAAIALSVPGVATAHESATGLVYTETNASGGNAVLACARAGDGSLTAIGSFATGGLGSGGGLGSQGAVTLAGDGRWQLAVNAGSNDISTFRVRDDGGLVLTDHTDAAGTDPVSLTANGHVVCVLDAGGSGNIAGFRLAGGSLHHLAGSGRPLSGLARNPAEIAFSTDGEFLVATERATTGATTRAAEIKPARYRCAEAPPLLAALGRMAHAAPLRGSSAISTARWLAIVAIAARSLSARGQAATLSGLGAGWLDHRVSGSSGRTPPQPGAPLRHVSVRFGNPGRRV